MSAPINYPQIKLSGQTYFLKFGLKAIKRLKELGITELVPKDEDSAWTQLCNQVAATACVETDGQLASAALAPEWVREAAGGDDPDFSMMQDLRTAVDLAVSFRMPSVAISPIDPAKA